MTMKIWHSTCNICLGHCSETINGNCLTFSGHINQPWDLHHLTIGLDIMTIHLNVFWANTQTLYMIALSYFQSRSILHGTCALSGYFDLLTFSLENMTFTLKTFFCPLLRNYKWQQLHILWSYHENMGPVHCKIILTFWPLTLILWPP